MNFIMHHCSNTPNFLRRFMPIPPPVSFIFNFLHLFHLYKRADIIQLRFKICLIVGEPLDRNRTLFGIPRTVNIHVQPQQSSPCACIFSHCASIYVTFLSFFKNVTLAVNRLWDLRILVLALQSTKLPSRISFTFNPSTPSGSDILLP